MQFDPKDMSLVKHLPLMQFLHKGYVPGKKIAPNLISRTGSAPGPVLKICPWICVAPNLISRKDSAPGPFFVNCPWICFAPKICFAPVQSLIDRLR